MFPTHSVAMLSLIIPSVFELSPVMMNVEGLNGVFHQADCRYAVCHHADWRGAPEIVHVLIETFQITC